MQAIHAATTLMVRPFRRDDFEALWELAKQMHAESPHYREWPLERGKLQRLAELAVDSPALMCGLVAEAASGREEGRLLGVFLGAITEPYFGPGRMAVDLALFVPADRRGGLAAARLIRGFEEWARAQGATVVQLGVTTGVRETRTERFYQQLGFAPIGAVYRKSIPGG